MSLPSIPGMNVFIISPPAVNTPIKEAPPKKKESKLIEMLKKEEEDKKHREMIQKMEEITGNIRNLPHLEASAGGT